jgi:hypothetical protein
MKIRGFVFTDFHLFSWLGENGGIAPRADIERND